MGTEVAKDTGLPSPGNAPPWLQVWLEAGQEGQVFTYANPPQLAAGPGDLVRVRLKGRAHTGLVVGTAFERPPELGERTARALDSILQKAAVDPHWRNLIEAVAQDCHCSLFRCLRSCLPPGWLGHRPQRQASGNGGAWIQISLIEGDNAPREAPGLINQRPTSRQLDLLKHLTALGGKQLLRDLVRDGFSRGLVASTESGGWIRRDLVTATAAGSRRRGHGAQTEADPAPETPRPANPAQAAAIATIRSAPPGACLLLWGVTGAGKTEVYLQAASHEQTCGRSVLLLAPEIGLIPQLLDRCRARFGSAVLEYHSGLGEAERIRVWRRCLGTADSKESLLVVGTRSAIFLPMANLGLIVLDEEHDGSYKQDSPMPCYHARDVARHRARLEGARLVLGSATPSLETWLRCRGSAADTHLVRLPERISQRPLPPVHVVDMRHELAEGHRRLISRPLLDRLQRLPATGAQGVLLIPRRGYRTFQSCRSCGEAVLCPHCDVSLAVHRRTNGQEWLRCHWCDHRQEVDGRCGRCGSTAFKAFGAGTQRVLEQLSAELPELRLLRFDADTTRGRDGHRHLLERFAAGEADVLIGTQMLAKGMDLPRVTLAAVLAADGLLHRPDLRATETSLQLLLQLAGRAGRGERPGEVLVQTYSPDHPVIRHLVDGRYERFLEAEEALRSRGGLVPFSRACLLRLAGPSAATTATAAAALASLLEEPLTAAGWELIGPAPAPVARVAGRSRWQLLLHGPAASPIPLPKGADLQRAMPKGVSLAIDPDPLEL